MSQGPGATLQTLVRDGRCVTSRSVENSREIDLYNKFSKTQVKMVLSVVCLSTVCHLFVDCLPTVLSTVCRLSVQAYEANASGDNGKDTI